MADLVADNCRRCGESLNSWHHDAPEDHGLHPFVTAASCAWCNVEPCTCLDEMHCSSCRIRLPHDDDQRRACREIMRRT